MIHPPLDQLIRKTVRKCNDTPSEPLVCNQNHEKWNSAKDLGSNFDSKRTEWNRSIMLYAKNDRRYIDYA